MTWKRKKTREIKSAKELLRIHSSYKKVQSSKRNLLIGTIALLLIIYLSIILFFTNKEMKSEQLAIVFSFLIIFILIVFVINKSTQRRGSTFLITEKGILLEPDIAEYWMDIKGYEWETFRGFSRLTVSDKGKGSSLLLAHDRKILDTGLRNLKVIFDRYDRE